MKIYTYIKINIKLKKKLNVYNTFTIYIELKIYSRSEMRKIYLTVVYVQQYIYYTPAELVLSKKRNTVHVLVDKYFYNKH